jgi:rhodanese-related sulfurtransferase
VKEEEIYMGKTMQSEELRKEMAKKEDVLVIDVRRKADYEANKRLIPGAVWQDPELVDQWGKDLPRTKPIVVYCARGGSVSQSISHNLIQQGVDAAYLEGGLDGWETSGGEVKEEGALP